MNNPPNKEFKTSIFFFLLVFFLSSFNMVGVIQNIFFEKSGVTLVKIGIILSAFQLSKMLFEVPTGIIADRYGKKKSVLLSFILEIASFALMVTFRNYYVFLVAMFLGGISYTLNSGALDAILIDHVIEYNAELLPKINQITRIVYYVAIAFSSVIGGIIANYSYPLVYWLTIFMQLVAMIFFAVFVKDDTIENETNREVKKKGPANSNLKQVMTYLKQNKNFVFLMLISIFVSLSMIPIDSYYSIFLYSMGLSTAVIGGIVATQFIFCSFIGLVFEGKMKNISDKIIVLFFPIFMMLSFLGFAIIQILPLRIFCYFLGLLIFCLYSPRVYFLLHNGMNRHYRATILSINSLVKAACAVIIQPVFGFLTDRLNYSIGFSLLICFSLLFLIFNVKYLKKYLNFN